MAIRHKDKIIKASTELPQKSNGSSVNCLAHKHLIKIPHTNVRKGSCWIGTPSPKNAMSDALDREYVKSCMDTNKPDK